MILATAQRVKKDDVTLPPPKFPRLSDEEEAALPPDELATYEQNRRAESLERRRAAFTGRETLTAYDAATGDVLWTDERDTPVTRFPQSSTPAAVNVAGLRESGVSRWDVVHLGGDRTLRKLRADDGAVDWEIRLPGEFDAEQISSSPLVQPSPDGDGWVWISAGSLFCVSLGTGEVLWENDEATGRHSSPALGPGFTVIVNVDGGETVGVDALTGAERWRIGDTGASRSSPVVVGDRLLTFGSSRKGGLRCYRLPEGRRHAGGTVEGPSAERPRRHPRGRRRPGADRRRRQARRHGAGRRRPAVGHAAGPRRPPLHLPGRAGRAGRRRRVLHLRPAAGVRPDAARRSAPASTSPPAPAARRRPRTAGGRNWTSPPTTPPPSIGRWTATACSAAPAPPSPTAGCSSA